MRGDVDSGGWLVGGLGAPYDDFVAAALGRLRPTQALGALDADAMRLGRAALPRGQCAPLLATTGALLRTVAAAPVPPAAFVSVTSCGPCRYAVFGQAFRRVLERNGGGSVLGVGQSLPALTDAFGAQGASDVIDALLAADALVELKWRCWPRLAAAQPWLSRWQGCVEQVALALRAGQPLVAALGAGRELAASAPSAAGVALPRVALIGEPWSLHVDGDAQGGVARALCEAGVCVETPPLWLWLAYRLWEEDPAQPADALVARYRQACGWLGFEPEPWPTIAELARLAEPYLPASLRGGYGHVEVGLAVRARELRRVHAVVSVKSFGCIPSSGVSDGIVPAALGDELPFLSLEISEDGAAARDSRLMLLIATARARAAGVYT